MTQTFKWRSLPSIIPFLLPVISASAVAGLFWWRVGNSAPPSPYTYRFISSVPGKISQELEREISLLQQRIKVTPSDGMERANLAQTYLKMAKATGNVQWYLLAEQSAKKSLANLPFHNSSALVVLARIAEAKHDFSQAISLANQVLKEKPQQENALSVLVTSNLAIANLSAANQAADRLVAKIPSLNSLSLRALVKVAQAKDAEAIADFQSAIGVEDAGEPGASAKARSQWGRFYFQRGKLTEARQLYDEALRILPRYPLALVNLAELEIRQGNYQAAENLYAAVYVSPAYPSTYDHIAWYGIAQLKELQGDRAAALVYWQKAKSLLDQHSNLNGFGHRRELAKLLLARGNDQDLPQALALMQAELKIRRDPETLDTYAWVLTRLARWQEAQTVMQEALSLGTRNAAMFERAANIEKALGNSEAAIAYRQKAQATDPTFNSQAQKIGGLSTEP